MFSMNWDSWFNEFLLRFGNIWFNAIIWIYVILAIYVVIGIVSVLLKKRKLKKYFSVWKLSIGIFFIVISLISQFVVYKEIPMKFDGNTMDIYWIRKGMADLDDVNPKREGKALVEILNEYKVKRVFNELESPYQVQDEMYQFSIMNDINNGFWSNYHFIITPKRAIIYSSVDETMQFIVVDHDGQFYKKVSRFLNNIDINVN